ncbi:hypothetical protein ACP3T3_10255 [Chryseobacterium sp. CBSDS_008]|uniref:hypothetical protein n=1 Tax=Chryseobacterium sp. CBSDS_008 TaxID=3415265 RepID=UPI003CED544F
MKIPVEKPNISPAIKASPQVTKKIIKYGFISFSCILPVRDLWHEISFKNRK